MTDFRIDLRSLTDTERELIEAAIEKLHEASVDDHLMDTSPVYREAGALARALAILQARKPKPAPRKRKTDDPNEARGVLGPTADDKPATEQPPAAGPPLNSADFDLGPYDRRTKGKGEPAETGT